MTEIIERSERKGQAANGTNVSLSLTERIVAALPKSSTQRVIVRQVGPFNFRANWFDIVAADETGEFTVKTWKIVDSKFLHVIDQKTSLVIADRTRR